MHQSRPTDFQPGLQAVAPKGLWRMTPQSFAQLARMGELGLIALCFGAAFWVAGIAHWPVADGGIWLLSAAVLLLAWARMTRPAPGQILGGFDPGAKPARHATRLWMIVLPMLFLFVFICFGRDATHLAATGLIPAALLSTLWRSALARLVPRLIRKGVLGLRIIIAGGGREARDALVLLAKLRRQGVQVLALFDDRETARSPPIQEGVAKLGRISDIPAFLQQTNFDLIIVTMPRKAEARLSDILSLLWPLPVDIRLAPVQTSILYRPRAYRWLGGLALLDLFDRPLRAQDAALKRVFDLLLGGLMLIALAPVMLVIAVVIRLDSPGPVFFRQPREGYAGRPFDVWKFRSLQHGQADLGAVIPVTEGDSRVSRVGRLLRKTSLDEVPQLLNVLQGQMSLVGPRPHAVGARNRDMAFANVVRSYAARHRVKPGMTGLAQIRGFRGPVESKEQISRRVALDLDYIDRWSLFLDLQILFQTLPSILRGENAV